ncbi:MAG: mercuric transporter MerT family protein [Rhodothermales bacterium]
MDAAEKTRITRDIVTAVAAALAASACCLVPLALVSLGMSGAWVSRWSLLVPYRPAFALAALGMLGFALYREYRMTTAPACACDVAIGDRTRRLLLAAGSLATIGLLVSPYLFPRAVTRDVTQPATARLEEVVLGIEGMTCPVCVTTTQQALAQLPGVGEVEVTLDPPEAHVRFDTSRVSPRAFIDAVEGIGFSATVMDSAPGTVY